MPSRAFTGAGRLCLGSVLGFYARGSIVTSNQRYGAYNRRFDRRAAFLRKFGFTYRHVAEIGKAVFQRKGRRIIGNQYDALTADFVLLASNQVWFDALSRMLVRSF